MKRIKCVWDSMAFQFTAAQLGWIVAATDLRTHGHGFRPPGDLPCF